MRLLLLALCHLFSALAAEPPNLFLGTQAIGGRYQFTEDEPLLESAKVIADLGSGMNGTQLRRVIVIFGQDPIPGF